MLGMRMPTSGGCSGAGWATWGVLSTLLPVNWSPSLRSGDGQGAVGNGWADTPAKLGAADHEVPEEDLPRVKA